MKIRLKCECGKVKGALQAPYRKGGRSICMCKDCQSYAHYLGKADRVLDANGGSEILPFYPSQVEITEGQDQLQCMRLSSKGLFRWFTKCCHTPVANTVGAKKPYAGIFSVFVDLNETEKDNIFGPINERIFGVYGKGPFPPGTHQKVPVSVMAKVALFIVPGMILGKYKGPFFDHESGRPVTEPVVISKEEREKLLSIVFQK